MTTKEEPLSIQRGTLKIQALKIDDFENLRKCLVFTFEGKAKLTDFIQFRRVFSVKTNAFSRFSVLDEYSYVHLFQFPVFHFFPIFRSFRRGIKKPARRNKMS